LTYHNSECTRRGCDRQKILNNQRLEATNPLEEPFHRSDPIALLGFSEYQITMLSRTRLISHIVGRAGIALSVILESWYRGSVSLCEGLGGGEGCCGLTELMHIS
jgi:hypothetical protein